MGVIDFKTIANKFGFVKKMDTIDVKWLSGDDMWSKSNDTIQKRCLDKELGMIKHMLMESGHPQSDVKIKWKKAIVELKGAKVAEVVSDEVEYHGDAVGVKDGVREQMRKWKEKRNIE